MLANCRSLQRRSVDTFIYKKNACPPKITNKVLRGWLANEFCLSHRDGVTISMYMPPCRIVRHLHIYSGVCDIQIYFIPEDWAPSYILPHACMCVCAMMHHVEQHTYGFVLVNSQIALIMLTWLNEWTCHQPLLLWQQGQVDALTYFIAVRNARAYVIFLFATRYAKLQAWWAPLNDSVYFLCRPENASQEAV